MKQVVSNAVMILRARQLFILLTFCSASLCAYGQWRYDNNSIPQTDIERFRSTVAASQSSSRAYAVTEEHDDFVYGIVRKDFLRVSNDDGFPFSFGRKYSLEVDNDEVTAIYDLQVANEKLYLNTNIGMLSMPVDAALPPSPGVIDQSILTLENNNPTPGFFHVPTGSDIDYAYIGTPTGILKRMEIDFSSDIPQNLKVFASNVEITAITSGGGRLFVGTRNTTGNTNSEMINRYTIQALGLVTSSTLATAFSFSSGGGSTFPRQNVLSLAVVNGNRLCIGTQSGMYRVDDLTASSYTINSIVVPNPPLQSLINSIMSSQINQMVALGTKLYVSSSSEGILYFPDATLTVMDVVYRYNEGFTRQSRKMVSGYSSGGPVLYTLDSDSDYPFDILKSRAFDNNCFVTVSISNPSTVCTKGSRFTFTGNACGNLNLQYLWTGATFYPNNTSSSVLSDFFGTGAYTISVNVKSADYGLNATFPFSGGASATTLNVPSTAPSNLTSTTSRDYTLNLVFQNGEFSTSCDLSGQQLSSSWTRGNGQKVVSIARIGGSPGIPGRLSLTHVAGTLADGNYSFGTYPVLADNGTLVGYLVYKGTQSSGNSNIPLSFPITVTGSSSNVGVRTFEVNENTCGFSISESSNRTATSPNTDASCQSGRISRGLHSEENAVEYFMYTYGGRMYLSINEGESSISSFTLTDLSGKVKYSKYNFDLNGSLEIPYESGVREFLVGRVLDVNGNSKVIKIITD